MKQDVKNINSKEAKEIMKKYKIKSIHVMSQGLDGYNAPFGIGFQHSEENYIAPLFYFKRSKTTSIEEYMDYLALFKYAFYQKD